MRGHVETGLRLAVLFCISWAIQGCLDPGCTNTEVARYAAPNGKLDLVVFERNCGATTSFTTQASLVPSGRDLSRVGGNIFVADTDHGKAPAAAHGGPELDVEWLSKSALRLTHSPDARVFLAEQQSDGVTITYSDY